MTRVRVTQEEAYCESRDFQQGGVFGAFKPVTQGNGL